MESGNSSSMQSSSGGDDQEYESSGGVIGSSSANYYTASNVNNTTTQPSQYNNSPTMFMLSSTQQPQPPLLPPQSSSHHQHQTNYLDAFETQSNYQNLMFWQQHQQFGGSGGGGGGGVSGGLPDHPSVSNPTTTHHLGQISTAHNQQSSNNSPKTNTSQHTSGGASGGIGKNPRKRTRASRRAPTTVLTTDTSNFRAMVQEFTGIPSSPFSAAASPLLSRRLTDLLSGNSSNTGPTLRPGPSPPMVGPSTSSLERLFSGYNNNYPLRPSAHKLNTIMDNTPSNTNLSFQSLLQSTAAFRYPPPSVAAAPGLLSPNVGNFQDLSGLVMGSDPVFGFAPTRLAPEVGGWRSGSSGEGGDHGEGNISGEKNDNNNVSNQQMGGSISGGGTSNYNVNMNCSRDKGLDSSIPNRGGDFLG